MSAIIAIVTSCAVMAFVGWNMALKQRDQLRACVKEMEQSFRDRDAAEAELNETLAKLNNTLDKYVQIHDRDAK